MKSKLCLFLFCLVAVKNYSLDINVIDISKNDNIIQIDIEISSDVLIYLPENILTQRIYQHYKGFSSIDEIRDMNIDGVSGGVSRTTRKLLKPGCSN